MNWGIVGLGRIARQFADDLKYVEGQNLYAVAARSKESAQKFAEEFQPSKSYSSYVELFNDSKVDIVYIATPHHNHAKLSIEAMEKGKHVLCEKPIAVNAIELDEMIVAAKSNGVFLMEALWSKFNPSISKSIEMAAEGHLGEVNYINADFSFNVSKTSNDRMLSLETAGGALLEMGIYPVFLAYSILGIPEEIHATARLYPNGGDLQTAIVMKFKNGIANLMCGYVSDSDMIGKIYGTKGSIYLKPYWHEAQGFTLIKEGKAVSYDMPTKGKGFTYEIEECFKCISHGELESQTWTHNDSRRVMSILDEIRKQIGLHYQNDIDSKK